MPSSTMRVFSCVKSSPRLFDTFTAATNCPRFLKPFAASMRSVFAGRRVRNLSARFVFFCSFCWTGVRVTVGPDPVPVVVGDVPVVVVPDFVVVDVPPVECGLPSPDACVLPEPCVVVPLLPCVVAPLFPCVVDEPCAAGVVFGPPCCAYAGPLTISAVDAANAKMKRCMCPPKDADCRPVS